MRAAELLEQAEAQRIALPARLSQDSRPEVVRGRNGSEICAAATVGIAGQIVVALNGFPALAARLRDALTVVEAAQAVGDFHLHSCPYERGVGPCNCPEPLRSFIKKLAVFDAGPAAAEEEAGG